MASIKGNIVLNGINTVTGILFPIITFPYAARILLPEGIGAVNFLNSIISYIVLLTSLGIPMYAVKEIAKYQNHREKRDKITIEIIILSLILCICGYAVVWLLARFVPQISSQCALFYILSLTILFNAIGVNWFYQGIEDFKFITIRAVIIRTLAAAALFIFVKGPQDLRIYGFIIVGSTVGNNLINFIHLRKHLNLNRIILHDIHISRHFKPASTVFILNLITSLYIQLNTVMLGFMQGDEAVGYFSAGTKISHITLTLVTSIGTVLLPRCAHLLKNGETEKFNGLIIKSLNATIGLSLPLAVGLMALGAPITLVFCGADYLPAIPVLYLNAPVILLISLTNLLGLQILYPMDKINLVINSVLGGAIINLLLNIALIPIYSATGAAIATLAAEFTVLVMQWIYGRRYYPFPLKAFFPYRYIIASCIMGITVYLCSTTEWTPAIQLLIGLTSGTVIYLLLLAIMGDPIIKNTETVVRNRMSHGKQTV